jgi:hypothetical protein
VPRRGWHRIAPVGKIRAILHGVGLICRGDEIKGQAMIAFDELISHLRPFKDGQNDGRRVSVTKGDKRGKRGQSLV